MKQKNLYSKETLIRKEVAQDSNNTYSYELIMKESHKLSGFRLPLYTIRVGFTDENGNTSNAEVSEMFADPGKAILFFEKLVRNLATPIDTAYILEDEIAR